MSSCLQVLATSWELSNLRVYRSQCERLKNTPPYAFVNDALYGSFQHVSLSCGYYVCTKGVPILHERIGEVGTISWVHAAPYREELGELEAWFSDEASVALRASPSFQFFPVVSL